MCILIPEQGVDFDAELARIEIAYLNAARGTGGQKRAAGSSFQSDPRRMKYLCGKRRIT